jgi:hypothetical protein
MSLSIAITARRKIGARPLHRRAIGTQSAAFPSSSGNRARLMAIRRFGLAFPRVDVRERLPIGVTDDARRHAAGIQDVGSKQAILHIADGYEFLAQQANDRAEEDRQLRGDSRFPARW